MRWSAPAPDTTRRLNRAARKPSARKTDAALPAAGYPGLPRASMEQPLFALADGNLLGDARRRHPLRGFLAIRDRAPARADALSPLGRAHGVSPDLLAEIGVVQRYR